MPAKRAPHFAQALPRPFLAWLYPLIIAAAVLLALGRLATSDFVAWDDSFNLYHNPRLNPPTAQSVAYYWTHAAHGLYIPLTYTVWAGLAAIARVEPDALGIALNPWIFHGANVAVHIASALAAFAVLARLIRSRLAACIGALFYALHPVQVEAVGWAAGMKDLLSGLLVLVAVWKYLEYAKPRAQLASDAPQPGRKAAYAAAILAFVLGMLAKPSAMVAPALLLVIDLWLLRRTVRAVFSSLAPWFALSLACAIVARLAQDTLGVERAPIWVRPFVAGDALAFYLFKLIWPMNLALDYGRRPQVMMQHGWFYAMWLVPAVLGLVLWLNRRRWPELFTGAAIFAIALSPVLGLASFQFQYISTVADHYLYVAMLGPALAAAWLFMRAWGTYSRRAVVCIAALVLFALGARSFLQAGVWQDNFTLFNHVISVNPASSKSMNNLGHAHNMQNELERAEALFRRAIELDQDYWLARVNLASVLEVTGRREEAVEQLRLALQTMLEKHPWLVEEIPKVAGGLARDLAILGRYREAIGYLELALGYRPDDPAVLAALEEVKQLAAAAGSPATLPADAP